jgi:hypothetical protein
MSLLDIGKVIRLETGDYGNPSREEIEKQKQETEEKEKEGRWKSMSICSKAFQMFKDRRPLADVAIELNLKSNAVLDFYDDYLRLIRMEYLGKIYKELEKDFPLFLHLCRRIKKENLNKQDITDLLQNKNKLIDLNEEVIFYNNHIIGQQLKIQQLQQTIDILQSRISNYDGISPP